jgi:hypothetical protein
MFLRNVGKFLPGCTEPDSDRLRVGRPRGSEFESRWGQEFYPQRPDQFWSPHSLLSNGYRGIFPRSVKLTTHLQLAARSKIRGSIHPLPHTSSWCSVSLVKHRDMASHRPKGMLRKRTETKHNTTLLWLSRAKQMQLLLPVVTAILCLMCA